MLFYTSDFTGSAYTLDGDALLCTPLYEDLTFDTAVDNWVEVDFDSMEEGYPELVHVKWIRNYLRECTQA